MKFVSDITSQISAKKSHICVGLDSDYEIISKFINNKNVSETLFFFNKEIVDATSDICVAYKANLAFYAAYGVEGLSALIRTNKYIKSNHPAIKIIADCKRSEMKRSAEMAAKEIFDEFLFDSLTITPWFGFDTVEPYLKYSDRSAFVLCHDSNPSAGDIQDLKLADGHSVYEKVTDLVCNVWNEAGNVLIEAPLTYPGILQKIKNISDSTNQFFLIAGLGAQGGNIQDLLMFKDKRNFIVNASRGIIFNLQDSNFALGAREKVLEYNSQIADLLK